MSMDVSRRVQACVTWFRCTCIDGTVRVLVWLGMRTTVVRTVVALVFLRQSGDHESIPRSRSLIHKQVGIGQIPRASVQMLPWY